MLTVSPATASDGSMSRVTTSNSASAGIGDGDGVGLGTGTGVGTGAGIGSGVVIGDGVNSGSFQSWFAGRRGSYGGCLPWFCPPEALRWARR